MKNKRNTLTAAAASLCLFILILDTKTAVKGVSTGIEQCIGVIIPSLYPFFLASGLFCQSMQQMNLPVLSPIRKLCKIPKGTESLLIIGLLGGYPVGAREITNAYNQGVIDKENAERMLGFCSNAGPSFIFGIIASQFSNLTTAVWIFIIHILSAILTGAILPGGNTENIEINATKPNYMSVFNSSIRSIVSVCGWVVIFRVIITFLDRWILWITPKDVNIIISGILELANGCIQLKKIQNDGLRMIICSAILSLGGICVYLQTISVTQGLGTGMYFPGKCLQCCISVILSAIVQIFLFDTSDIISIKTLWLPILALFVTCTIIYAPYLKKTVAIQQ